MRLKLELRFDRSWTWDIGKFDTILFLMFSNFNSNLFVVIERVYTCHVQSSKSVKCTKSYRFKPEMMMQVFRNWKLL